MKKKTYTKVLLILTAFVGLMFISEGIYVLRNNNEVKMRLYLNLSLLFARISKVNPSLNYLGRAAEIRLLQLEGTYPQVEINTEVAIPPVPENTELIASYVQTLQDLDPNTKTKTPSHELAKVFYTLGLLAYQNNEPELVVPFWQVATNLAPEWSYFHIELANFYLKNGNKTESENQLKKCVLLNYPKKHCQIYFEENFYPNLPEEVEFMRKFIEEEI